MGTVPLILEEFIPFDLEVSVIAARGRDGEMSAYEAARNVHRDGILHRSTLPAGVPDAVSEAARQASFTLLEALDYVGIIGVEFFVTADWQGARQ